MPMIRMTACRTLAAAALLIAAAGSLFAQSAPKPPGAPGLAPVKRVEFGAPFPAAKFANLNEAPGQPASVELATYLGKKPIVFVYWMAGNPRAEKILMDTQAAVDKAGADKAKK